MVSTFLLWEPQHKDGSPDNPDLPMVWLCFCWLATIHREIKDPPEGNYLDVTILVTCKQMDR